MGRYSSPVFALAIAVTSLGCGKSRHPITNLASGPACASENQSGTRLRARNLSAEGGVREFRSWFDSERQEECTFQRAHDGELHCMPLPGDVYDAFEGSTKLYRDDACNEPIVDTPLFNCTPYRYVRISRSSSTACVAGEKTLHSIAEKMQLQNLHVKVDDGPCMPESRALAYYYVLGEPIPANAFVKGTFGVEGTGSRIRAQIIVADDGAEDRQVHPTMDENFYKARFDSELGLRCSFFTAADGKRRCLPSDVAGLGTYFTDSGCLMPLADQSKCEEWYPAYARIAIRDQLPETSCRPAYRLFALGKLLTDAVPIWVKGGDGSCTTAPWPMTDRLFEVHEEVAPVGFAEETASIETLPGRLSRRCWTTSDGFSEFQESWEDTERKEACAFQTASDGQLRCLARGKGIAATVAPGNVEKFFSDDTCTVGVSVVHAKAPICNVPFEYGYERFDDCADTVEIRPLESPVSPTAMLFRKIGDNCLPVAEPGSYVEMGASLAPQLFHPATLTTE